MNDAHLSVPSPLPESSGIHFSSYQVCSWCESNSSKEKTEKILTKQFYSYFFFQSWDLVRLTQNYLKLILHFLKHGNNVWNTCTLCTVWFTLNIPVCIVHHTHTHSPLTPSLTHSPTHPHTHTLPPYTHSLTHTHTPVESWYLLYNCFRSMIT